MIYSANVKFRLLIVAAAVWLLGVLTGILLCEVNANASNQAGDNLTYTAQENEAPALLQEPTEEIISLGVYKTTGYCPCEQCCGYWSTIRETDANGRIIVTTASGAEALEGKTIAAAASHPFGTELIINGHTYIVQDRGGAITENCIDVYFDDHKEALNFGVQYIEVFKKG